MSHVLALDLGGTKLSSALFNAEGEILLPRRTELNGRVGEQVGELIATEVAERKAACVSLGLSLDSIGIAVPGSCNPTDGTVWAPNIPGWDKYPLRDLLRKAGNGLPVVVDDDRACSILGERWQGNAKGVANAIFLTIGTGIGAGILMNDVVLRGAHGTAGSLGWMGLGVDHQEVYAAVGDLEYHASGTGIANAARRQVESSPDYQGMLRGIQLSGQLTASDVFAAYHTGDAIAVQVLDLCVKYWGVMVANLVSLFDPEVILFGGGVFGPANSLLPMIREEARKWAQPLSFPFVKIDGSALGPQAVLYGAGSAALHEKTKS
jgi:glucokinase